MFCPSVRWLQRIPDVCQAYADSHGIIFNCNKTVCMTQKAQLMTLGGENVKYVKPIQISGDCIRY